jgi:hypothetical protein
MQSEKTASGGPQGLRKDMTNKIPFPRAYWVIPEKFLAGGYPGSKSRDLSGFFDANISQIINLMEPNEQDRSRRTFPEYASNLYTRAKALNHRIKISRKPIPFGGVPSPETLKWILGKLDMVIHRERLVYLHSREGLGRVGLVVGCYLVRHGMTGEEALGRLDVLRRADPHGRLPSPKTEAQRKMVLNWRG